MDFMFSPEQEMLKEALARYLRENYSFEERRTRLARHGHDAKLWGELATGLGILGATLPVEVGGLGGSAVDTMIIQECLGEALVTEPFLEAVILCGGILRRTDNPRATALLQEIADGTAMVAFAASEPRTRHDLSQIGFTARVGDGGWRLSGDKIVVVGAAHATHLIIAGRTSGSPGDEQGLSLFLAARPDADIIEHSYRLIDERRAADLTFNDLWLPGDALLGTEGEAWPLIQQAQDEAIAALCAETVGILRRMLADTVDYCRQRKQFGQPLAAFQALQHRMVDMFIRVEEASAASLLATLRLDADPLTRTLAASAAKATIAQAARFVGQNAVQLHGAMGLTEELAVGHYFKRATVIEGQFGSSDYHLARYARLSRDRSAVPVS